MKVTFVDAIRLGFKKFRVFRGTASRREYWFWVLFTVLLGIVLSTIESIIWPPVQSNDIVEQLNQPTPLSTISGIILLLPSLSLTARRLRDAGWSARWLLLFIAPVLGLVFATLALIFPVFFASLGVIGLVPPPSAGTIEQITAAAAFLAPILLLAVAVQIFIIVLTLLPTKTKEAGNRYAN